MRVSIWDVDYFYKKTGVNYDCMKISSYHKQRGDKINFITSEFQAAMQCDVMYITKEDESLKNPPIKYTTSNKSKIWGKGMKYLVNYKIPAVILACRPDYLLYQLEDKFDRSDAIQFFDYDGKLLPKRQDEKNTFKNKKTLVIDKMFWSSSKENLLFALQQLKRRKNIAFLEPISIKRILSDVEIEKTFLELNFTVESRFEWRNNYGSSLEEALRIIDFIARLNERTTSFVGVPRFAAITSDHFSDQNNALADLKRCLLIMAEAKKRKVPCEFKPLKTRLDTPYIHLFETIIKWSQKSRKMSLVEFAARPLMNNYKCSLEELFIKNEWWINESFCAIVALMVKMEEDLELFLIRWGKKSLPITKINMEMAKKYGKLN